MPRENHQPVKGYAGGFLRPDPARDLAAYDELPRPARRALDDAPFAISAVAALAFYREHGIMALMREIQESADQYVAAAGGSEPFRPVTAKRRRR
jgi:hypothetical protein